MNRFRPALLAISLAITAVAPGLAADEAAKAFLRTIYRNYTGTASKGLRLEKDAHVRRHFTPATADLMIKDGKEAAKRGEVGRLDFDPFVNGQDWEVKAVDVRLENAGPDRATGVASFVNAGTSTTVRYDLVK
ncbi:MAG: hypothetical protein M3145_04740, partial [Pseudomonadota bacterium]|nr:hypothetical protein [Pseudomonadota bacterium]